jgi:hypothetical protein
LRNNNRNISCIPTGFYNAQKHIRPNGNPSIWIQDVPKRAAILIHWGNYASSIQGQKTDILGCILVGETFADLNHDNILDINNSKETFQTLYDLIGNHCQVIIEYTTHALSTYQFLQKAL